MYKRDSVGGKGVLIGFMDLASAMATRDQFGKPIGSFVVSRERARTRGIQ
jgi:hypothetical protein